MRKRPIASLVALALAASTAMNVNPPTEKFGFPTISIDRAKLGEVLRAQRAARIQYGLGAKAPSLSATPDEYRAIDCSGESRLLIYQGSGGVVVFPDGSVTQREACERVGFKASTYDAGFAKDGVLRIAFLSPEDTAERIGHVALILDGATLESHGHHGPDSRLWGSEGWMSKTHVYVLTAPGA